MVKWEAPPDGDVAGYRLMRQHLGGYLGFTQVAPGLLPVNSYIDQGPFEPGATVTYKVKAVDGRGNESPYSPESQALVEQFDEPAPKPQQNTLE